MKLPKYIIETIKERARAGQTVIDCDNKLNYWLKKKGYRLNDEFYFNSIFLITEPFTVAQNTIKNLEELED